MAVFNKVDENYSDREVLTIFLSYSRKCEEFARSIVDDIKNIGHTVWFDQDLNGGQIWWNKICDNILKCDLFVFVLNQASLSSIACRLEYEYANNLGKPILPVLVSDDVSTPLLPPALSEIQFIDYRQYNRDSAFRLARALTTIPLPKSLPDPLPNPPEVPISQIGNLTYKVESITVLSEAEQSSLVLDLKRYLRDQETANAARTLLHKMKKRHDLFMKIAEEVDELLANSEKKPPSSQGNQTFLEHQQPLKNSRKRINDNLTNNQAQSNIDQPLKITSVSTVSKQGSRICAIIEAILGIIIAFLLISAEGDFNMGDFVSFAIFIGGGGIIAGAISGTNKISILFTVIGAGLGWFVVTALAQYDDKPYLTGGLVGLPLGAIIGSTFGVSIRKKK